MIGWGYVSFSFQLQGVVRWFETQSATVHRLYFSTHQMKPLIVRS